MELKHTNKGNARLTNIEWTIVHLFVYVIASDFFFFSKIWNKRRIEWRMWEIEKVKFSENPAHVFEQRKIRRIRDESEMHRMKWIKNRI